ncbi:hypothetical protein R1sor_015952 [Riccia sorocarpa]|uniref:Uncharacterized protein n=1 Tax=Riccia sorocarpa TaxID=122646 RepID=A0ABD3HDM8_9MARC
MDRNSFGQLLQLLEPVLSKQNTRWRNAVPACVLNRLLGKLSKLKIQFNILDTGAQSDISWTLTLNKLGTVAGDGILCPQHNFLLRCANGYEAEEPIQEEISSCPTDATDHSTEAAYAKRVREELPLTYLCLLP